MTPEEAAYCAGLYEGEGNIHTKQYKSGLSEIVIAINMADKEPLEKFLNYTQVGSISYNIKLLDSGKYMHNYHVNGIARIQPILDAISPWLSPRRLAQIEEEVSWYWENDIPERRGKSRRGRANSNAALKEDEVKEIKQMLTQGIRQWEIARKFGVSNSTISGINTGYKWKHI